MGKPDGPLTRVEEVKGRRAVRVAGRAVLWMFVLLVLVRGIDDVIGVSSGSERRGTEHGQRDDAVRAFAVTVARGYLTGSSAVRRYAPDGLSSDYVSPQDESRVSVAAATVAAVRRLSRSRQLITVACELAGDAGTRYVAVPIRSDSRGSLGMFALPAVVAGPTVTRAGVEASAPLDGSAAAPIERLVERFLAGYLHGGDRAELGYLIGPGARVHAAGGLELVGIERVGEESRLGERRRVVVAEVRARDRATEFVYPLAYRLELVRRDRWYVARVQGELA